MAVPRLREEACFLRLDPDRVEDVDSATTVGGAAEAGVQVGPREMSPVDLIVSGSVAVNRRGARVGKGEGYSDLEFAVLREHGLVDGDTTTATTVHETQVVDERVPTAAHDVPIEWLVTPDRRLRAESPGETPAGVAWDALDDERIAEIPILDRMRR